MSTSSLDTPAPAAADPARFLLDRLAALRQSVTALVEHRSADDPTAHDPLRGLYVSQEAVSRLLRAPERTAPDGELRLESSSGWPPSIWTNCTPEGCCGPGTGTADGSH
ncbi:hypothetical protein AB0B67_27415, partial [Streptomyces spectabilis]